MCIPLRSYTKDGLRRYTLNAYFLSFYYGHNVFSTFTSEINDYYYYSMQYRPPNAKQEASNTNHFGSVSDSLCRLVAAIEFIATQFKSIARTRRRKWWSPCSFQPLMPISVGSASTAASV